MPAGTKDSAAPWRFFVPHRSSPFPFFLDRGCGARASFAGSRPRAQLVVDGDGTVRVRNSHGWKREDGDPLERVAAFVARSRAQPPALPAWLAGAALPRTVGYLSYELGLWAEGASSAALLGSRSSRSQAPLAVLSTYDEIDAWDPAGSRSVRVRFGASTPGTARLDPLPPLRWQAWSASSRERYAAGFARIRDAIAAGDIYQANLSRRAVFELGEDAASAYERLRSMQPVPWGAFFDFGGFSLLSNSPESFLVRHGRSILTSPIKGTRPRRAAPREDAAEAASLRADPKEMAEHLMIVDLERNDLGRVAETGSVRVSRFAEVESFATVHHLVSDVSATLRSDVGVAALLAATFPGGSITGAPKIRAMEILAEVEDDARGPWTGAIGFFNGETELELSIAIRTAIASGGRVLCQAGGGIVADSHPDREWAETDLKLAALRRALEAAPPREDDSLLRTRNLG